VAFDLADGQKPLWSVEKAITAPMAAAGGLLFVSAGDAIEALRQEQRQLPRAAARVPRQIARRRQVREAVDQRRRIHRAVGRVASGFGGEVIRERPRRAAQRRLGGVTRTATAGASGSGVKSSPGLMKRSCSKRYCLSYSWR